MEKLNPMKMTVLGFQHVCVMYGGAIAVPLIVGAAIGLTQEQMVYLISYDLLGCGIATLLQTIGGKGFGIQLPIMMAVSFTVVTPAIQIGQIYSMTGILGAVIASGIIVLIIAQFVDKVVKYFPPLVTGSVVLIIGVSLMSVAMQNAAGGAGSDDFGSLQNLLMASFTLVLFFVFNFVFKGFVKTISILLALIVGTVVSAFFGMVDFSKFVEADWFTLVQPFYFGIPEFHPSAILTMTIIAIIIMIESVGVFFAIGDVSKKDVGPKEVQKGLRAEGLATAISGILNGFNHSTFSQNAGLVYLTKVTDRFVVAIGGGILIVLGLFPKVAALTTMIPSAVLGGAMIPMFGMLIAAALRLIGRNDLSQEGNQLVLALGLGVGIAVNAVPAVFEPFPETLRLIFGNGIIMGTAVLFFTNWILNGPDEELSISVKSDTVDEDSSNVGT